MSFSSKGKAKPDLSLLVARILFASFNIKMEQNFPDPHLRGEFVLQ